MWEPKKKRRKLPYFKVQVFNGKGMTWVDERGAFDTPEEAIAYIEKKNLVKGDNARLMIVTEKGRTVFEN